MIRLPHLSRANQLTPRKSFAPEGWRRASNGIARPYGWCARACQRASLQRTTQLPSTKELAAALRTGVSQLWCSSPTTEVEPAGEWRPFPLKAGLANEAIYVKWLQVIEQLEEMLVCGPTSEQTKRHVQSGSGSLNKPEKRADVGADRVRLAIDSFWLRLILGQFLEGFDNFWGRSFQSGASSSAPPRRGALGRISVGHCHRSILGLPVRIGAGALGSSSFRQRAPRQSLKSWRAGKVAKGVRERERFRSDSSLRMDGCNEGRPSRKRRHSPFFVLRRQVLGFAWRSYATPKLPAYRRVGASMARFLRAGQDVFSVHHQFRKSVLFFGLCDWPAGRLSEAGNQAFTPGPPVSRGQLAQLVTREVCGDEFAVIAAISWAFVLRVQSGRIPLRRQHAGRISLPKIDETKSGGWPG